MWWDFLDTWDHRDLQELRDGLDHEALKADGDSRDLQDLTESLACQEIQERQDPQVTPPTLEATWCHRWLQVSERRVHLG